MDHFPLPAFRPSGVKYIPVAHIATDVEECLDDGILEALTRDHQRILIQVIGSDLPNLVDPGYLKWRELLSRWLGAGANVEYLALPISEENLAEAVETCKSVVKQCPDMEGSLDLYVPAETSVDAESRSVIEELLDEHREYHFLLAINLDDLGKSQMWVESDHKSGSKDAHDCYYYRPGVASNAVEFSNNRNNFDFLKGHSRHISI